VNDRKPHEQLPHGPGLRLAEDVKNHAAISSTIQKAINDRIIEKGAFGDQVGLTDALKKIATDNAGAANLESLLLAEIDKQLSARPVTTARAAFYASLDRDFDSVITNRYSGLDGANKSYPGQYMTLIEGATSIYKTHTHHVVFKIGADNQKELVLKSQNYLLYWGIDPFYGQENLFWAPNKGHSIDVMRVVHRKIEEAHTNEYTRDSIVEALKTLATDFIDGKNKKGKQ
jgi:hypothetical protein